MFRLVGIILSLCVAFGVGAQELFVDLYSQGLALIKEKKYTEAIESFEQAFEAAPPESHERSRAVWGKGMALYYMAVSHNIESRYEEAYEKYEEAMKCFKSIKREDLEMDCAVRMASLNSDHFGSHDLAIRQYGYAYDLAEKLGSAEKQVEILDEVAKIYRQCHMMDKSIEMSLRADSIAGHLFDEEQKAKLYIRRGESPH